MSIAAAAIRGDPLHAHDHTRGETLGHRRRVLLLLLDPAGETKTHAWAIISGLA